MNAVVKNHCRSFALIVISLSMHIVASGQVTANFTASSQSGCSPLIVHFSDQSTGNPTQWRWDLGNGAISYLQNPSATYFNPGTYTIKLTVSNASGSDSIVKYEHLTVYANPVADFEASDTMGCFPLPVQFTDQSQPGSGSIVSWQWDFGDGTVSTQQNPSHIYTSAGNYNVTLKVTNSFGCVKALSKTQHITVSNGIGANFSASATGFCTAPATVQFNNTTPGLNNTFQWFFGDGTTSTLENPIHAYTAEGSYTVSLIAVSEEGCIDTIKKIDYIQVGVISAFDAPDTVCINQDINFINSSTPVPSAAKWFFGNGATSNTIHPVHKFTTPGIYTVKLLNDFGNCKDSVTKQIVVFSRPQAAFDANIKTFCQAPATVSFQSQSTGALSYFWNFGDGSTSNLTNPVHVYNSIGNFNVTLIVTSASGCSDTLKKNKFIQIRKPQIELLGLPATGCVPVTINPSANIIASEPVLTYLWNFGDGTTSNLANPQHTYTAEGNFDITLTITTTSGCTASVTMTDAVRAGNKPDAQFSTLETEVCNVDPVHFSDNSSGNVDQWFWLFGDSLTSTEQNPAHVFGNIGLFDVMLVVWSNTCPDTIIKEDVVNVLPPLALFNVERTCDDKYTVSFEDKSVGATSVLWDFGDNTSSTERDVTHTYSTPGVYKVVYKAFNSNCWNMSDRYIRIIDEKANLVADQDTVCKGSVIHFSSPGVTDTNIVKWSWSFADGIKSTAANGVSHIYENAGTYQVILSIKDLNGCIEKDTMQVVVHGPTAGFAPSVKTACLDGNMITFTSSSTSDGIHPIVQYIWNYGDGISDTTSTSITTHHYMASGNYTVSLTVTDNNGCSDVLIMNAAVIISKPVAEFSTSDTLSCTGKDITFENASTGKNLKYLWSFGDGSVSTVKNPVHTYSGTGIYTIKLVVTDKYGCVDSLTRVDYINISLPHAAFTVSDSVGTCPPLMVHFTHQSTGYTSLKWEFGDGNTSVLENPSHFYNTPGTFYARLIATGPGGCTDTATKKIVVKGPNGTFTYSPLSGCNPLTVSFTATTQNTTSLMWDFSDGTTIAGTGNTISHTYTTPGQYIPKIILTDASGCNYPVVGEDTVRVFDVTASFTLTESTFCNSANIQFENTSISNDLILGYEWHFGDGSTSTEMNPIHYYDSVGTFTVQLIAYTQSGCSDTFILDAAVIILPAPSVNIDGNLADCAPAIFDFKGVNELNNDNLIWNWNFGNGQTATGINPFYQSYPEAGDYVVSVIATATNGCKDTAIRTITVHPLPQTNAGIDVEICRGGNIQLQATGAISYEWNHSSSLSCADCPSTLAAPLITTNFIVTGISEFGCKKKDSVIVEVHQPFDMTVAPGDTICVGSSVHLRAFGADSYTWSPSSGIQNADQAHAIANPVSSTTYTVIGRDNKNCFTDTASVFIKVWPIPTVDAGADLSLVVGNAIQLNTSVSGDVSSYQWNNAGTLSCATCSTTLAKPKQTTTYTVQVKNDGGCMATDNVTVNVTCNNGNLFMPNTFSPNSDGVNDRFYPGGTGINRIKTLRVFNRWGEVVFERNDFNINDALSGWDGMFKGQALSPDVYIWNCDVLCENNEVLQFKGDVTLLR